MNLRWGKFLAACALSTSLNGFKWSHFRFLKSFQHAKSWYLKHSRPLSLLRSPEWCCLYRVKDSGGSPFRSIISTRRCKQGICYGFSPAKNIPVYDEMKPSDLVSADKVLINAIHESGTFKHSNVPLNIKWYNTVNLFLERFEICAIQMGIAIRTVIFL